MKAFPIFIDLSLSSRNMGVGSQSDWSSCNLYNLQRKLKILNVMLCYVMLDVNLTGECSVGGETWGLTYDMII